MPMNTWLPEGSNMAAAAALEATAAQQASATSFFADEDLATIASLELRERRRCRRGGEKDRERKGHCARVARSAQRCLGGVAAVHNNASMKQVGRRICRSAWSDHVEVMSSWTAQRRRPRFCFHKQQVLHHLVAPPFRETTDLCLHENMQHSTAESRHAGLP